MLAAEHLDRFQLKNKFVFHKNVRNKITNHLTSELDPERYLPFGLYSFST